MGFRKPKLTADIVPVADWAGVDEFRISEWIQTSGRDAACDVWAVRTPHLIGKKVVYAPCAFFGTPAFVHGPQQLFEDREATRVLLTVEPGQETDGQHHFRVLDARDMLIGTIRKVPPTSRPFKHTWRLDQPGRPEIAGRNEWSGVDARSLAVRVAGEAIFSVLSAPLYGEGDDSGQRTPRTLVWKGGSEVVMTSGGDRPYRLTSDWLDRRLAFAVALLGDQLPARRNRQDPDQLWAPRPA
ncbi:hypothetical protein ACFXKR_40280 [Streptomyces violascens]|uniref:hypothetical protein n=1 Tax=Streptomyces violascens TaxID=67381 RepID=UPI003681565C